MYKKVKDSNYRSGKRKKTCRFFYELDAILGSHPTTEPPTIVDSLDRNEDTNSDDGDSDEERDDDMVDRAGDDTEREDSATDTAANDTPLANDSIK